MIMNIKLKDLKTIDILPSTFESPMEKQEWFSIVLHNESMLMVQNNPKLLTQINQTLDKWLEDKDISLSLYLKWQTVLDEFKTNPEVLIEKSDRMQQLRSISPFSFLEKDNKKLRKEIFDTIVNIPVEKPKKRKRKVINYMNYA